MRGNMSKTETTPLPSPILVPLFFFFSMVWIGLSLQIFSSKILVRKEKKNKKNLNPCIISSY